MSQVALGPRALAALVLCLFPHPCSPHHFFPSCRSSRIPGTGQSCMFHMGRECAGREQLATFLMASYTALKHPLTTVLEKPTSGIVGLLSTLRSSLGGGPVPEGALGREATKISSWEQFTFFLILLVLHLKGGLQLRHGPFRIRVLKRLIQDLSRFRDGFCHNTAVVIFALADPPLPGNGLLHKQPQPSDRWLHTAQLSEARERSPIACGEETSGEGHCHFLWPPAGLTLARTGGGEATGEHVSTPVSGLAYSTPSGVKGMPDPPLHLPSKYGQ